MIMISHHRLIGLILMVLLFNLGYLIGFYLGKKVKN
jgi:uncharacterized protein YneF (UPF0154 family)